MSSSYLIINNYCKFVYCWNDQFQNTLIIVTIVGQTNITSMTTRNTILYNFRIQQNLDLDGIEIKCHETECEHELAPHHNSSSTPFFAPQNVLSYNKFNVVDVLSSTNSYSLCPLYFIELFILDSKLSSPAKANIKVVFPDTGSPRGNGS